MENLINQFINNNRNKNDLLTEDDLRCKLFFQLEKNKKKLPKSFRKTTLHSEIRRYGNKENGERPLKYRSDLVYINQKDLEEFSNGTVLPSKGYAFNTYECIIELKLRRPNGESDKQFIETIKSDIKKLEEIKRHTTDRNDILFYIIVIDKKSDLSTEINNLLNERQTEDGYKVFYKYIAS